MPADAWAKLATAIADLTKTIFATRESAYNRKMDKRQERAIQIAKDEFETVRELFVYIHEEIGVPEDKLKGYSKIKTRIYKLHAKFDVYD